jgi:alkylglycerol monooxygenase
MSLIMLFAIPVFLLTIVLDWLAMYVKGKKDYYRFADTITNLNLGVGSQATGLLSKFILLGIYDYLYTHFSFFQLGSAWYVIIACTLLFDFIYYWAHRWAHEMNFFWGAHVVHHQSEEYNLSVALRQSWLHNLIAFPLFLPMAFLGFNTLVLGGVAAFVTLYQYWIHTQAINKFPVWFEYVFNTPSHHRVHHGVNGKYLDKNHGAFLIIWDRMFGTFKQEEEVPDFGITTRFASMNPVWANIHYYADMFKAAAAMQRWQDKLKIIFARPGWLPEELGGFQQPKEPEENRTIYDTTVSLSSRIYVAAQFVLILWGIVSYMMFFDELNWFYRILFFGILTITLLICGAILENKSWVVKAETVRIIMAAMSISTLYYYQFAHWLWLQIPAAVVLSVLFTIWLGINYKRGEYREAVNL